MTTRKNTARSENSTRAGSTDPPGESDTGASESDRSRGNRRTFLQGVGVVGTISLAGCTVTFTDDGISWGDDDGATPGGPTATPGDEPTATPEDGDEEDDEIDLSEYEDGCFSGGTPAWAEGVRDGVEITVSPAGVETRVELLRETIQFEYHEDLELRDDVELVPELIDDEDDDDLILEAELVEVDEDDDIEYVEAELIILDDEEDDDE